MADLHRMLHRKVFYICAIVFLFVLFFVGISDQDASSNMTKANLFASYIGGMLASLPIFIGLFGDDMKSGSTQCAIGRGMSRYKVVCAKFLDGFILIAMMFVLAWLFLRGKFELFDIMLTDRQQSQFMVSMAFTAVKTAGCLAFSLPFLYFSLNASIGMLADMVFIFLVPQLLKGAQGLLHIGVYDLSFTGLMERAEALIAVGRFGWQIVPAIVIFIGGALTAAAAIFSGKEMEF